MGGKKLLLCCWFQTVQSSKCAQWHPVPVVFLAEDFPISTLRHSRPCQFVPRIAETTHRWNERVCNTRSRSTVKIIRTVLHALQVSCLTMGLGDRGICLARPGGCLAKYWYDHTISFLWWSKVSCSQDKVPFGCLTMQIDVFLLLHCSGSAVWTLKRMQRACPEEIICYTIVIQQLFHAIFLIVWLYHKYHSA